MKQSKAYRFIIAINTAFNRLTGNTKHIPMKRTLSTIIILGMLMGVASCKKSLLNQDNPNTLTVDQFWKTETDAQKGVNSIYAMFFQTGGWNRWIYFRLDLTSDEGFSNSPWTELGDWTRFQYINYNFFEGNVNTYRDFYKAIFRCNQVLTHVPDIQFADAKKKAQLLAQAKFLRGYYNYYGAVLWENFPLVTTLQTPTDLPVASSLAQVWVQVEKDLQEASADLPEQWTGDDIGRPTKGAAQALLGKALMQQHKWTEAKTAFDYLVTGAGKSYYALVDFKENFRADNENNRESVFEIQFSDANKTAEGDAPNSNLGTTRAQFFAPRSIGWSDGQARYWTVGEFKKEKTVSGGIDPRLRYTLFYPALEADFGDKTYGRSWQWGADEAWFKKYSRDYYRTNEDYFNQVNNRVIRYADVLLMYAEALNELGQTTQAYTYVNMVRQRSNMATLELAYPAIGSNKDLFRTRLKTERLLELCGESVRWADLKRWGDLDTQAGVNEVALRDPDFKNFVVGKHIRLPLPQIEVENNTNLKQNPNY
ncbi:RagB/SusD family nutrient uptake outer membrane protein [Pedobacter hartonius]|uniref:Starch-binding associating with outer membrane n=1 Tax=Pedobacter hartonius TaxID=425514 RepID=A0A1H3W6G9_9SPHI|nr:RagB/SusD family nutrient uptake outer membrane protein [Pedobacter hartonius]SDZ81888.1 Starch-binding associating with outer membrane [Pedobacter hartonius]